MRSGLLLVLILVTGDMTRAQYSQRMTRTRYFETYKEIAIREMHRSGVPASITLAQGALESADGNSRLALNGNNHFGIKCHNDWNGKRIFEDDDAKNECFRKYNSVEDSYRDHSDYLKTKSRYTFLFELSITDYKGWARGLRKAGYATSPTYADALIKIIEEHDLDLYDRMSSKSVKTNGTDFTDAASFKRPVLERNRVKYILARKGDTFESVTAEFGKLSWELPQYNDVVNADSLFQGQVVYLQPKRKKAEVGKNVHVVKEGETMYTISQLYAVKLSFLYSMNQMNPGTIPHVGTILNLRKTVRGQRSTSVQDMIQEPGGEEEIRIDLNMD
jgi:LysM repeat protein